MVKEQATLPKKILILAAIPHGLRLDKEIREVEECIRRAVRRDMFDVDIRTAVRPQDIRRAIAEEKPQIVHFCGHGLEDGSLLLEDDGGQKKAVPPEGLASLFKLHARYVNCVLLNACHSVKSAEAISKYIDYAIGMNQQIQDKSAIQFAQGFYDGLGYASEIPNVFKRAFDEGLVAITLENLSQAENPVLKTRINIEKPRKLKELNSDERKSLLKKVDETRVKPFLGNRLINQDFLLLKLENRPEDTKIIDIFDNEMRDKRTLLIFGEPGSGKTTILAKLAEKLIERAKEDNNHQIPIILNLSSWKNEQNIDKWIETRLKDFYHVPEEKGQDLVKEQKLLLLIDGFDELKLQYQKSCVNYLNNFLKDYQAMKIVVCSRTDDNEQNEEKEKLLQKLTSHLIVRLQSIEFEKAIKCLKDNSVPECLITLMESKQDLIKVPLFLYLIIEVYKDSKNLHTTEPFERDSEAKIRDQIFNKYIEKQLNEWENTQNYSQNQNTQNHLQNENNLLQKLLIKIVKLVNPKIHSREITKEEINIYLNWLAKQMQKDNQTEFLIEKMQPKLLSQSSNQVTIQVSAYRIGVRLIVGMLCGLSSGLLSEILNYNPENNYPLFWINYIFFGLISGLLSGLISGLISLLPDDIESRLISSMRAVWIRLISSRASWLPASINSKLMTGLRFIMIGWVSGFIHWLVNLLLEGGKAQPLDAIIFGIFSGFIFYRLNCQEIETVGEIKFSLPEFISTSINGVLTSLFFATSMLIIGIFTTMNSGNNILLIDFRLRDFLKSVFYTPWISNFLKNAVEPLILNDKPRILDNSAFWGALAFGLLVLLNMLIWMILEDIENKKIEIIDTRIKEKLALVGFFIFGFILTLTFSQKQEITFLFLSFLKNLNVLWGLLTLELFVGIQVGIILGFEKINKIEDGAEPNDGIIKTRINAVKSFAISGFLSIIVSVSFWYLYYNYQHLIWWIYYKPEKNYNGILFGLFVALTVGLLSGLINGGNSGLVCIKHFVLRVVLWLDNKIPWNYASFLSNAAERKLLIQTGGSYRFRHVMLLQHFVEHYEK
jgi:GTPase SAR1 family protein